MSFFSALQSVIGGQVNQANIVEWVQNELPKYKRIGSDSATTQVFELSDKVVLKYTRFDKDNSHKRDFFRHNQAARLALVKAIHTRKRYTDRPLLSYFVDCTEWYGYEHNDFGLVIEGKMKGKDMRDYFVKACAGAGACKEDDLMRHLIGLVMVLMKIIFKLYKLGVNHNDLHDANVFLVDTPCTVSLYNKTMHVSLPFTPVIFDFDWTVIGDLKQPAYPKFVTKDTPACVLKQVKARLDSFDVMAGCHFHNRHRLYTYPGGTISPSIDLATFMMSLLRLVSHIMSSTSFKSSQDHAGYILLKAIYNICVANDFDITKSFPAVQQLYRAYVSLTGTDDDLDVAMKEQLPKRRTLGQVAQTGMEIDGGRGRGLH